MLTKSEARRILASVETLDQMLIAWRKLAGITATEAAARCGLSVAQWSRMENGKRMVLQSETFTKLSEGTGIDVQKLYVAAGLSRQQHDQPVSA